ncbi:MAG: hypothetical protein HKN32_05630 [Flavobacteriales bacterium]|nr:hypothetical protein [Flavobacteriales bacterium]
MKATTFSLSGIFSAILLSSCTYVVFEQSIPPKYPEVEGISERFQGKWSNGDDSFTITQGEVKDAELGLFDDAETIFKEDGDWLYVNFFAEGFHHVGIGNLISHDQLEIFWFDPGEDGLIESLKKVTKVKEVYDEEGEIDAYVLNPSKAQWQVIQDERLFTSTGTYSRVD